LCPEQRTNKPSNKCHWERQQPLHNTQLQDGVVSKAFEGRHTAKVSIFCHQDKHMTTMTHGFEIDNEKKKALNNSPATGY
jgi:hypothetical protein